MSLTVNVLDSIIFWTDISEPTDDGDAPTGAEAVERALAEFRGLAGGDYTARLGEPDIGSFGGEFVQAPQVVIPLQDTPAGDAGELVLDIEEFEELFDLMEVNTVAEIAGYEVPIVYKQGEVHVRWDKVAATATEKGSEDDEWSEDQVEAVANGADADDDEDADSGVTVEMEEVSPSSAGEAEADD